MKKILTLLILSIGFQFISHAQLACPHEVLVTDSINCTHKYLMQTLTAPGVAFSNDDSFSVIRVCRNTTMKYFLTLGPGTFPTFQITSILVSGGVLISNTNSNFVINWGSGNIGTVQIQFTIPGGPSGSQSCMGTITLHYKLLPNPIAAFSAAPNPACFNNPTNITFNSSASVGATTYFWDFGDGFTSNLANPVHAYTTPGTYTVCLTVSNSGAGGNGTTFPGGDGCPSCYSKICHDVVISNLPGPDIFCVASVCAGESGTYCTTPPCSTAVYHWIVTGGSITSGDSTTSCITVAWGLGNPQGNIHLDITGCSGLCPLGTDVTVPIIPVTTTIAGSSIVCVGATSSYSLPAFPGTTYSWSISGGQSINGNNTNTTSINTTWNNPGIYTVTCVYFDTALNCGGTGTIVVTVLPEMKITGPFKVCAGFPSTLNAVIQGILTPVSCNWTVSAGATLTSSNPSTSATFNWPSPGTYTVTATPNTANIVCSPVSYLVTVYPQPLLSSINGPDSICGLGSSTYSATSNMAGVFSWVIVGGTPSFSGPNNDSVTVTWNVSGTYSISVTQSSYANNCISNTLTKVVYGYPTPIVTGAIAVCADNNVTYTITNIGATNFNWHITPAQFGTVISTAGSSVLIKWHGNNNPGGTNVVYLHYGNCKDDSIAITISEPVAPNITSSGSLCAGAGITLTATGSGTFSWSHVEAPPYSSNTSSLTNINHPGHYTVQIQMTNGCTVSATYNIPNVGRPVAQISAGGPLVYCDPNLPSMNLSAVVVGGYTFQWFKNNAAIVGATSSTYNVNPGNISPGIGNYIFTCVVSLGGCTDTSNSIVVSIIPCPFGTPDTTAPCGAGFSITNINGCNPFTVSLGLPTPSGSSIVPGSITIFHYDDLTTINGNTTKTYSSIGFKQIRVCATILKPGNITCRVCKDTFVTVIVAAKFLANKNCNVITLTDLSSVQSGFSISPYAWSVSPAGIFNNPSNPSPVLTVPSSGTYTITLTVTAGGCTTSYSEVHTIALPDANFLVSNSCVGTTVNLSGLVFAPTNYWNFGDATSSNTSPTFHAYASTGFFNIVHSVVDSFGCTDTVTKQINITAAPTCTITATGPTTFCSGDSVKLSACTGYTNYQWEKNGVAISGATSIIYYATQTGTYSFTALSNIFCNVSANTVTVTVNQSPSTSMTFNGKKCFGEVYSVSVPTCNSCLYQWEVDGNVIVPFSALNTYSETIGNPPFLVGPHLIKVTIIGANLCVSMDSVNVIFNPQPTVTISVVGNPAQLCSNNIYILNAASNAASPAWAWTFNNFNAILSSTYSLTASAAGAYHVLVTDGITGCTNSTFQTIDESPDLTLFPLGCDTLCQNTSIFLPLASFGGNVAGYTITWYDNAPPYTNIVGTGVSLNLNTLTLGAHNLSVIVVGPNGCVDTSNVYYIYVVPSTSSNVSASACGSYLWTVNNITYTVSGTYTNTSINPSGCPQYDTLQLIITNGTSASVAVTSCHPYTWQVNGVTYSLSGIYTYTKQTANGCIHTDSLLLTISPLSGSSQSVTACGSYLWTLNGMTYSVSGTYIHVTFDPATGCDHVDTLILVITPNSTSVLSVTACDTYTWNGVTYTASGTYTTTTMNANGCIHISTLILVINYTIITTQYITACGSYTWPVNGVTYTANCVYTVVEYNGTACPHLYVLCLTILPNTSSSVSITACNSYLWLANNMTYTASGTYTHTSLNAYGCLHTATLNLTIRHSTSSSVTATACNFYTWNLNGVTYTASGTYTFTTMNAEGCPHTTTLNLTILNGTSSTINVIACDSYTWLGVTYTASGNYTHTSMSTSGCLQTTILHLTINYSSVVTSYVTTCGPYTWTVNGVTYTASGTYMVMTIGTNGCPRLYVLCLTRYPNTTSNTSITACNSYLWPSNGQSYTASGVYTYTSLNVYGCVHTATLNLTIHQGTSSTTSATACNSYLWNVNGATYTASGTYTITSMNTQGCPNISTLNLTIYHSINSTVSVTACDVYTWTVNGVTYNASGVYTFTSQNTNGCINTWVLNLTIHHATSSDNVVTACDSYTWNVNGVTYTASGNYMFTYMNTQGCPHTAYLILTINHSSNTTINVFGCEMYTWAENGVTYTASGTYTQTSINSSGCLHTATLILTLGTSTITHIFDTACCSYTWTMNGVTYTQSGIYPLITTGPEGCPHFYILCVTIYPCTPSSSTVIACGSYIWNGVTYTTSGTYTHTSLNAFGCPVTDTLHVTIGTGITTTSACDTVCDFFIWNVNGVTYTVSGVYTYVVYDPTTGCPHVYILCITIRHHTESTTTATAVNTYTWNANGMTYTTSGVYTATLINSHNCDSLLTLDLQVIIQPIAPSIAPKAMLSGPYQSSIGLMHDSLRVQNLIPLTEPYSGAPYYKLQLLGGGGETTTASVLSVTGNNAIVDWVHIEIRSGSNSHTIIATKNALLQRDGDIVSSVDGMSPLTFPALPPGNYFISIKHRNHLGVMTATPISLTSGVQSVDYTTIPLYSMTSIVNNTPANFTGALKVLWSGDPNYNKNVKYNGSFNDRDPILITVGVSNPNNTVNGYRLEDLNMDGKVRYNNTDNDRAIILSNVGATTPNKVLSQHTPN